VSFSQVFGFRSPDDEPDAGEGAASPPWFGPPDDLLGIAVAHAVVLGRSDIGAVALSHTISYPAGAAFEFLATVHSLSRAQANRVFHEQHVFEAEDELPDGLLRIGIELADGARVSNLDGRALMRSRRDEGPAGPTLFPHGGGGGSSSGTRVVLRPGYWLWPLPPAGALRVSCEWPLAGIPLSTVELDAASLRDAAGRAAPLWP
jgi:hypothetical protein